MSAWYARLAWVGKSAPPLSTWTIFTITVTLSLPSYLSSGNRDALGAISNITDLFAVWSALIAILFGQKRQALKLTKADIFCLLAIVKVCVAWAFVWYFWSKETAGLTAFWYIQGIMVIAYWPTITRLWKSKELTEPFGPWLGVILSMSLGLGAALTGNDRFPAAIYPLRAVVMVSIVIAIIVYKRRKLSR
ncbi:MAG: hypothetical protein LiPW15_412 [Parcubacteria group bacterium LiPW_15]|nr:MAG: hypothetical protein LiPW15_412 [Parcubacteria group bacterium LiPW_15]